MMLSLLISVFIAQNDTLTVLQKSAARESVVAKAATVERSAASYLMEPLKAYTSIAAAWNGRREESPAKMEEGDSMDEGQLNISTLVRPTCNSAVRGSINYARGLKRNVIWNTSSDYDIVYPYTLADTVGGNLNHEKYQFSGGYSALKGNFLWGLEGAYRAFHEYRDVDPRPRNIVSDLNVRGTAGLLLGGRVLEGSLFYRRYSQSQNVTFVSERGRNTSVFHLTGLGDYNWRFSGASDAYLTTRYSGNGVGFQLATYPKAVQGWRADASYTLLNMAHYLPNQNEALYTQALTREIRLNAGYIGRRFTAGAHAAYQWREGIESVLDNGKAGRFLELTKLPLFGSSELSAGADAAWQLKNWSVSGSAEWSSQSASGAYPEREMTLSAIDVKLGGQYLYEGSKWNFLAGAEIQRHQPLGGTYCHSEAGYCHSEASYCHSEAGGRENLFSAEYESARFQRLCQGDWRGSIRIGAERAVNASVSIFANLCGQFIILQDGKKAAFYNISIGCHF